MDTHGVRGYIKKDKKVKVKVVLKKCLEEEKFGIKKFETYKFGDKVYQIGDNVKKIYIS